MTINQMPAGVPQAPEFVELAGSGLEAPLTEVQSSIIDVVHRFAAEVMRPAGMKLDRMTPEEVAAKGSLAWQVREQIAALGLGPSAMASMDPADLAVLQPMIWEELGWGDSGLGISIGAGMLPLNMAHAWGKTALIERFPETLVGCWGITEPDHGSDMLDADRATFHANGEYGRPSCLATLKGNKIVLNGQKSAWVSNGTIAEYSILFTPFERGRGAGEGIVLFVPLNLPGVSRGKPLDKLGQRALNQGEIFFDNVEVPLDLVAVEPEQYKDAVYSILCGANASMGAVFVGVARAAYEYALTYAQERKQGGVPIIRHQHVRYRLFHMFRKVEAARALARRVHIFNATAPAPALQGSIASKITSTQTAFEVASEAIQMFGGAGVSREYPVEKLMRDARASMIEDGCNEFLAIKGGSRLVPPGAL
jgi:alkylation response protein AidB-like acyl-CoA dehydrogenase